jgi:hypothetical protein
MTTRRWMISVAIAAIFAASCVQAQRLIRYASALRDYTASTHRYEEGRLLPETLILRSQRVMEAQLDLAIGRGQQIRAITAHLTRAYEVIRAEANEPLRLHDRPELYALHIEEALKKGMLPLLKGSIAPEVKENMSKCQDQLRRLKEKR